MKKLLSEDQRYDVVDAVITAGFDHVVSVVSRGHALMNAVDHVQDFKTTVESFNRVGNLPPRPARSLSILNCLRKRKKASCTKLGTRFATIIIAQVADGERSLSLLGGLKEPITGFFDSVMVMAEDEAVRANRLALLSGIDGDLKRYADFTKLVW